MRTKVLAVRAMGALITLFVLHPSRVEAITPGVDIAFPRVVICTTNDTVMFNSPAQIVEQGDYVRWQFNGTLASHTTTSGAACLAPDSLWAASLNSTTPQFTRQFVDDPGVYPYYCSPHCSLGMKGMVTVTTPIDLQASFATGTLSLAWSGGGGTYSVLRSNAPAFAPASTVTFLPLGGASGTTFTDSASPAQGAVLFYLVTNQQP
jgi:plastocyanin